VEALIQIPNVCLDMVCRRWNDIDDMKIELYDNKSMIHLVCSWHNEFWSLIGNKVPRLSDWSSLRRFVNKHLLKNNKVILHVDSSSSLCKLGFLYDARFGVVQEKKNSPDLSSIRPDNLTVRQNEITFFPSVTRWGYDKTVYTTLFQLSIIFKLTTWSRNLHEK